MILDKRSTRFTIMLCLAAITACLSGSLVYQRIRTANLSHAITEESSQLSELRRSIDETRSAAKQYDSLTRRLGGALQECSWSEQMPFAVSQINGIFSAHGVKIQSLRPEPMIAMKSVERFPLRVVIKPTLKQLVAILKDLKSAEPLIHLQRLNIRTARDFDDTLEADMTITSFVVLDKHSTMTRGKLPPLSVVKDVNKKSGSTKPANPSPMVTQAIPTTPKSPVKYHGHTWPPPSATKSSVVRVKTDTTPVPVVNAVQHAPTFPPITNVMPFPTGNPVARPGGSVPAFPPGGTR